jgi:hypothetical protein
MNAQRAQRALLLLILLSLAHRLQAGMIGDSVTSVLHTAAAGSWSNSSATVGAGAEFAKTYQVASGGLVYVYLDIADTSFTFKYINNIEPTSYNPTGSFNLGLDGFEFTDLKHHFTGVTLARSTGGFPVDSITNMLVTATNIQVFMNEPIIPGLGTSWTATWNVTFAPALTIAEIGQNVVLSWPSDATGYILQRNSNLIPGGWADLATRSNRVAMPKANAMQFYRLIKR